MSNRQHSAVIEIVNEIEHLSKEEIEFLHGIEIYSDGTVYDLIDEVKYASVTEWAESNVDDDTWDGIEGMYDDLEY